MSAPIWIPCSCGNYWCLKHKQHAHECPCPPVEEWDESPYGTLLGKPVSIVCLVTVPRRTMPRPYQPSNN